MLIFCRGAALMLNYGMNIDNWCGAKQWPCFSMRFFSRGGDNPVFAYSKHDLVASLLYVMNHFFISGITAHPI
jgi:hypothetical protein